MSKQTAVQLLKESLDAEMKSGTKMIVNWDMYLAMEREQIEEANLDGAATMAFAIDSGLPPKYSKPSEYFNQTFKPQD